MRTVVVLALATRCAVGAGAAVGAGGAAVGGEPPTTPVVRAASRACSRVVVLVGTVIGVSPDDDDDSKTSNGSGRGPETNRALALSQSPNVIGIGPAKRAGAGGAVGAGLLSSEQPSTEQPSTTNTTKSIRRIVDMLARANSSGRLGRHK